METIDERELQKKQQKKSKQRQKGRNNLLIITANETITNLTKYELTQEESDLLKASLYFSIQAEKIRKFENFISFEKIRCSFLNNLKSEETTSQIKCISARHSQSIKSLKGILIISFQTELKDKSDVHHFKLSYISNLSHHIINKLLKLSKVFCKENFNIKLVFSSFKIKNYFSYKDPTLNDLKSFLVCKFTCVSCSSSYIVETSRHFKTRIEEHIEKDNKSHIFKHLHSTATCFGSYNSLSF